MNSCEANVFAIIERNFYNFLCCFDNKNLFVSCIVLLFINFNIITMPMLVNKLGISAILTCPVDEMIEKAIQLREIAVSDSRQETMDLGFV